MTVPSPSPTARPARPARPTRLTALVVGGALVLVALLSGCGPTATATAGADTTRQVTGTTATPATDGAALTQQQADALFAARTAAFARAARAFHKCDHLVWDNLKPSPCRGLVAAETATVQSLLGGLESVRLPASYGTALIDTKALVAAGAGVAQKCAGINDQPCDQALARFRAEEQAVVWDLNLQL